jgi:hypothetical protein
VRASKSERVAAVPRSSGRRALNCWTWLVDSTHWQPVVGPQNHSTKRPRSGRQTGPRIPSAGNLICRVVVSSTGTHPSGLTRHACDVRSLPSLHGSRRIRECPAVGGRVQHPVILGEESCRGGQRRWQHRLVRSPGHTLKPGSGPLWSRKALNCAAIIRAGGERPGERTANEVSSGWDGGQLRQHAIHGRLVGTGEWRGVWERLQVGEQLLGQAAGGWQMRAQDQLRLELAERRDPD